MEHLGLAALLLPAAVYLGATLALRPGPGLPGSMEGLVKAHVLVLAGIALASEALSAMEGISAGAITLLWSVSALVALVAALVAARGSRAAAAPEAAAAGSALGRIARLGIALLSLLTLLTALLYPPNTWDSMTYHMARVMHWIANRDIGLYPTGIARQNYAPPLAELAILHLYLLAGSDLLVNLVQWWSYVVVMAAAYAIAVELELPHPAPWVSAVVAAAVPMAVLQASSTQNDLVTASLVMAFALSLLRLRGGLRLGTVLFAALAFGLALYTKGTAYVYCAAIGVALALPLLFAPLGDDRGRGSVIGRRLAVLAAIVGLGLVLNTGFYLRNLDAFGDPLSGERGRYTNQEVSLAVLGSNLVRNLALHAGTPSAELNLLTEDAVGRLLGARLNDPGTTWGGTEFGVPFSRFEETAGNLPHLLLAAVVCLVLPLAWLGKHLRGTIPYALALVLGLLLYAVVLKWNPWASRLHTPLFTLAAPLLAIPLAMAQWRTPRGSPARWIAGVTLIGLLLYALVFALANQIRPLLSLEWLRLPRATLYFASRPHLEAEYVEVMDRLSGFTGEVGVYLGENQGEYLFWALRGAEGPVFRHLRASLPPFPEAQPLPVFLLAGRPLGNWPHAGAYGVVYRGEHVTLLRRLESERPGATSDGRADGQ